VARYSVAVDTIATSAATDQAACEFWNPHGSAPLAVTRITIYGQSTTAHFISLRRTTAQGTAGITITPDLDNAYDRLAAPHTGVTLGHQFSVQPTLVATFLTRRGNGDEIGFPVIMDFPVPVTVPAGTGLALVSVDGVGIPTSLVTFEWDDPASANLSAYYCSRAISTLGAGNLALATLWNPHGTKAIDCFYFGMGVRSTDAADRFINIIRTSTRGTAGTSSIADSDHHVDRLSAPASGAIVDAGPYSVEPTQEGPELLKFSQRLRIHTGTFWQWACEDEQGIDSAQLIRIPAGTGLAIVLTAAAAATARDVTFGWLE
jgi:hypothetical protein